MTKLTVGVATLDGGTEVDFTQKDTDDLNDRNVRYKKEKDELDKTKWSRDRASAYPPMTDYLDGIVKSDQTQIDKYISDCQAVKTKYPKE